MKFFILSVSALAIFVGLSSCEKHDWEKTKQLYKTHEEDASHDDHSGQKH